MGTFRILQFNMQFGQIWDEANPDESPIRIEETIKTLSLYDADILVIQEIEQARDGGKQINPPPNLSLLQNALPDYQCVFTYPPEDERELPFGIGLAVFSRFPVLTSRTVVLPSAPVVFEFEGKKTSPTDRILLSVDLNVEGHVLTVMNTHLQAYFMINASSDDYPEQRNIVLEEAIKIEGPMVLTGDFNSAPDEVLVDEFEKAGLRTMQKDTITWKRMPYVLDHIFYNNKVVLKGGSVDEVTASDHHLLVADFKI